MEGNRKNPLINLFTELMCKKVPKICHKCPYEGEFELFNFTMSDHNPDKSEIFPLGYYKLVLNVSRSNNDFVSIKMNLEVTSTIKESFG